jgi:hypothetical protein
MRSVEEIQKQILEYKPCNKNYNEHGCSKSGCANSQKDCEKIYNAVLEGLNIELFRAMAQGIPTDRLREMCDAERDKRCFTPPCKAGDYMEWNSGISIQLYRIKSIDVYADGIRYNLGDFEPFSNHHGIVKIIPREVAEKQKEGEGNG